LVLEVGGESTRLRFESGLGMGLGGVVNARAEFFGEMRMRMTKLLEVVSTKLNLPPTQLMGLLMAQGGGESPSPGPGNTPLSEDLVKVVIDSDSSVVLDGKPWTPAVEEEDLWGGDSAEMGLMSRKRRRIDDDQGGEEEEWIVRTGQWRLRIQGTRNGKAAVECCLVAVKLDAFSSERARNAQRQFLGS
jgi:hypothetical protein